MQNSRTAQFSLWTDVSNKSLLEEAYNKNRKELREGDIDKKVCATHFTCYFCKQSKLLSNYPHSTVNDLIVIASNPSRYLLIDEVITCGCNTKKGEGLLVYVLNYCLPYVIIKKGYLSASVYNLRHDYYIQIASYGSSSTIQRRSTDFSRYDPYYYDDIREITLFHILIKSCLF